VPIGTSKAANWAVGRMADLSAVARKAKEEGVIRPSLAYG
jgi:hypothetical protein